VNMYKHFYPKPIPYCVKPMESAKNIWFSAVAHGVQNDFSIGITRRIQKKSVYETSTQKELIDDKSWRTKISRYFLFN
jgi:hypothetical protein